MHLPETAAAVLLCGFLISAVWMDHRRRRIPNRLSGALLIAALALHGIFAGLVGVGLAAAGALIGLGFFLVPYLMGGLAAGDVKLMAAVGAMLGPAGAVTACCAALLAGAAGGLLLIAINNWRPDGVSFGATLTLKFPYASSIAFGAAVASLAPGWTWLS